jgi:pyruvate/2-oxoglutarate dehydrogenase complex dihydrolipoamide dehydrogenase (E3) component
MVCCERCLHNFLWMAAENHFDLIVIGAGSGGVSCAERAISYGARVAIFEGGAYGGTCVNVGLFDSPLC